MSEAPPGWLPPWLGQLWQWFDQAGAVANFLQIGSAALAAGSAVFLVFRQRLRDQSAVVALLREDLARREQAVQSAEARADQLKTRCDELEGRVAEAALADAEREWQDGNDARASYVLQAWVEREGEPISRLLLNRAEWAAARAVGELRPPGLSVAEGFAAAAAALWPANVDAAELAGDLAAIRIAESQVRPPFPRALQMLQDADADAMRPHFAKEQVHQALASAEEAERLLVRGFYHLAMPLAGQAVRLLHRQLGPNALQTLEARKLMADILLERSRFADALNEFKGIAATATGTPSLGPKHRLTLACRYDLAEVLRVLSRPEQALLTFQDVAEAMAASPALGPEHPATLRSRVGLARVLKTLDRPEQALPIARGVAEAVAASQALGSDQNLCLGLAALLRDLGQAEEALPTIRTVAEARAASLGPEHPATLNSRWLLAEVLHDLGRPEQALPIIKDVAEAMAVSPALGPDHYQTATSRVLLLQVLAALGRDDETGPAFVEALESFSDFVGIGLVPGSQDTGPPNRPAPRKMAPAAAPPQLPGPGLDRVSA